MYKHPSIAERTSMYVSPLIKKGSRLKQKLHGIPIRNVYADNRFIASCHGLYGSFSTGYVLPLINLLKKTKFSTAKALVMAGDTRDLGSSLAFSKTKLISDLHVSSYTILKSLNAGRHWKYSQIIGTAKTIPAETLCFSQKKNVLIWRGSATGGEWGWDLRGGNRFALIEEVARNPHSCFNIKVTGFSRDSISEVYSSFRAPSLPIHQLRECKYLLSAEGNDKDTGLQWKLKSNSVVFMPRPKISSWLMEDTLIPGYHYIELRDDFKDMREKVEWCNNNPKEVIEIIKNAHFFMSQFDDGKREEEIEIKTVEKHLEGVDYIEECQP